jgi:uncharacterized membrane protein
LGMYIEMDESSDRGSLVISQLSANSSSIYINFLGDIFFGVSMDRFLTGFVLIILGFILVFLALLVFSLFTGVEAKGFGFILIGPIPIILSGGAEAIYILLIITIALIIAIVTMLARAIRRVFSP